MHGVEELVGRVQDVGGGRLRDSSVGKAGLHMLRQGTQVAKHI